jgi:hypothetical protein
MACSGITLPFKGFKILLTYFRFRLKALSDYRVFHALAYLPTVVYSPLYLLRLGNLPFLSSAQYLSCCVVLKRTNLFSFTYLYIDAIFYHVTKCLQ